MTPVCDCDDGAAESAAESRVDVATGCSGGGTNISSHLSTSAREIEVNETAICFDTEASAAMQAVAVRTSAASASMTATRCAGVSRETPR
jgi:hypothetical protein